MNNNTVRRVAAAAGIASVAAVGVASMSAGNAAAATLPNKTVTQKLIDGTTVSVSLTDQNYLLAHSTVNMPTSRHGWFSGKVKVNVNGKISKGSITAGYYVGCQVDFGAGSNLGGSLSGEIAGAKTSEGKPTYAPSKGTAGVKEGVSISLAPGQIGFIPVISYTDDDDNDVTSVSFKGNKAGIAYSQVDFNVEKCAGHASAKPYVNVKVSTSSVDGYVTLAGREFSLG